MSLNHKWQQSTELWGRFMDDVITRGTVVCLGVKLMEFNALVLLHSSPSSSFLHLGLHDRGLGDAAVIMTCQIRSDGTCSKCKHNSECSDDIFWAAFLLGEISRVTAPSGSRGSQFHNPRPAWMCTFSENKSPSL